MITREKRASARTISRCAALAPSHVCSCLRSPLSARATEDPSPEPSPTRMALWLRTRPSMSRTRQPAKCFTAALRPPATMSSTVPPGKYEMTVTVPGFKKYIRTNLEVAVAQATRQDVTLEVGGAVRNSHGDRTGAVDEDGER